MGKSFCYRGTSANRKYIKVKINKIIKIKLKVKNKNIKLLKQLNYYNIYIFYFLLVDVSIHLLNNEPIPNLNEPKGPL